MASVRVFSAVFRSTVYFCDVCLSWCLNFNKLFPFIMIYKKCASCRKEKSADMFHVYIYNKDGYRYSCKECTKKYNKKYYHENVEYHKRYQRQNIEKYRHIKRMYARSSDKEKYRRKKMYVIKKEDPAFRLKNSVSSFIRASFKQGRAVKKDRCEDLIGLSISELKTYIEAKFEPWMNWSNYGKYNGSKNFGWDIDHIIPISSAKTEEEVLRLNHYTNLQPLCSYINRYVKKDKVDYYKK